MTEHKSKSKIATKHKKRKGNETNQEQSPKAKRQRTNAAYYQRNKEKRKQQYQEQKKERQNYYQNNKEKIKANSQKYYEQNKKKRQQYNQEHKEQIQQYRKHYKQEHEEEIKKYHKNYNQKYYQEFKEQIKNKQTTYPQFSGWKKWSFAHLYDSQGDHYLARIFKARRKLGKHNEKIDYITEIFMKIIKAKTVHKTILADLKSELDKVWKQWESIEQEFHVCDQQHRKEFGRITKRYSKKADEIKQIEKMEHTQNTDELEKLMCHATQILYEESEHLRYFQPKIEKYEETKRILLQRLKIKLEEYDLAEANSIPDENCTNCSWYDWFREKYHHISNSKNHSLDWIRYGKES